MDERSVKWDYDGSYDESHHGCQDWCQTSGDDWPGDSLACPPAAESDTAGGIERHSLTGASRDGWVYC